MAPVLATSETLCRYVAHLAQRLKYRSIKQYINIVRILHVSWGLPNPLASDYHLGLTLRGIRRDLGDIVLRKEPITPGLLLAILRHLDLWIPLHASAWAACLLMFFGLLRRSNVLPDTRLSFDPVRHLRRSDALFTPQACNLPFAGRKTISSGTGAG